MTLTPEQRKEIFNQLEFNYANCSIWRKLYCCGWVSDFKNENRLSKSAKAYLLPIYERRIKSWQGSMYLYGASDRIELYTGIVNYLKSNK